MTKNLRNALSNVFRDETSSVPPSMREDFFFPIEQHFNNIWNQAFGGQLLNSVQAKAGYPKMDILKDDTHFIIRATTAGVSPEDLKVEVLPEGRVRLSGKAEWERHEDESYYVKELRSSAFSREVQLPDELREYQGDPEASVKDGVLILKWKLPQKSNISEVRLIEIKKE